MEIISFASPNLIFFIPMILWKVIVLYICVFVRLFDDLFLVLSKNNRKPFRAVSSKTDYAQICYKFSKEFEKKRCKFCDWQKRWLLAWNMNNFETIYLALDSIFLKILRNLESKIFLIKVLHIFFSFLMIPSSKKSSIFQIRAKL